MYGRIQLNGKGYLSLDTLIAFMKEFFEKNQQTTKEEMREVKRRWKNITYLYCWDISQFMTNMSQLMRYLYL